MYYAYSIFVDKGFLINIHTIKKKEYLICFQFMALSNVSKDKMITVEDLTNTYTTLFNKDMILVNLLGNNVNAINI